MSLLVKRHQWSENRSTNTETIYSIDSSSVSNKSSISNNQSELNENPVRHLFLVRHGQYQRQRTQPDGHLTAKGQKQAWYAANFLISQIPDNILFDSLTHSDSRFPRKRGLKQICLFLVIRTRETATIIYKQLKLMKKIDIEYFSIDTDFREHNLLLKFLLEGKHKNE